MTSIDTAAAFAGATNERNPSAKFHTIGDTYKGTVARVGEFSGVNDLNGKHETSVVIDLETADGTFTLWCRTHLDGDVVPNGITRAVADAVRAAGRTGLPEVGGTLAVRYDSDGQASKAGMNPPKIYRAQYAPPTSVPGSQAGGPFDQPAATAASPQPEAPTAQPAPQPTSDDLF
jgi:hypothetical protein